MGKKQLIENTLSSAMSGEKDRQGWGILVKGKLRVSEEDDGHAHAHPLMVMVMVVEVEQRERRSQPETNNKPM